MTRYILNNKNLYYIERKRKKRHQKVRTIFAPSPNLKIIQKELSSWFYNSSKHIFDANTHITGFIPNRSIIDNAKMHTDSEWVVNLDIEEFFPSTTTDMVKEALLEAQNKHPSKYSIDKLVELSTYQGSLPQGSPASPILANYVARKYIDKPIFEMGLQKYDLKYSRYADDLTFSTKSKSVDRRSLNSMINEIRNNMLKYKINNKKINIKHRSQRQTVTGIVVNGEKLSIDHRTRKKIRAALHNRKIENTPLDDEIKGYLSFIRSVNADQYNKLIKGVNNASN